MVKPKKAVIACQVLYHEILTRAKNEGIEVELLPQGLHDRIESSDMRNEIQKKIDILEARDDYDYIILAYGFCSGNVAGVKTQKASLIISLVHDCIPILTGQANLEQNLDSGGTYYLSRGWIDCAGDTYKQYLLMTGNLAALDKYSDFEEQYPAVTMWYQKDQYRERKKAGKYTKDMAEYVTFECIKNYKNITLIDNGNLTPLHYEYAKEMHGFLSELLTKYRGKGLDFNVIKGDPVFQDKLINPDKLTKEELAVNFLITPPGQKLNIKKYIYSQK